jgi:hypothetical protein
MCIKIIVLNPSLHRTGTGSVHPIPSIIKMAQEYCLVTIQALSVYQPHDTWQTLMRHLHQLNTPVSVLHTVHKCSSGVSISGNYAIQIAACNNASSMSVPYHVRILCQELLPKNVIISSHDRVQQGLSAYTHYPVPE